MKVCILSHCFPPAQGAAELYIGNLANELSKLGLEIVVITDAFDPKLPPYEESNNLKIYRFPAKAPVGFHNFGFMFRLTQPLERVYKKEGFDILHSEHIFPIPKAGKFSKKYKIPHVAVIEGISRVSPYSKMIYMTHKILVPRARYDVLVPWSRFLIEEFFKKWGIDEGDTKIIPGGIDTEKFNPFVDGTEVRGELVSHEHKLIFTAKPMNLTNAIGLAHIIKAMNKVVKEHRDCKLIIGGEGRKRKYLENLTRSLNLEEHVEFLGWVSQDRLPSYYTASDMIVDSITYRHAGSITVLESLASGKPNVLSNIECLPGEDSFPSEDIAVLSTPADSKDIAKGIITLLEDETLGKRIGKNAWKFVKENFSIRKIAKEYKALYEGL